MGTKPRSTFQLPHLYFKIQQMICGTTFLLMYAGLRRFRIYFLLFRDYNKTKRAVIDKLLPSVYLLIYTMKTIALDSTSQTTGSHPFW